MKKYIIFAALFCAMLLTSCGKASDTSAETSAAAGETTLHFSAEVTDGETVISNNGEAEVTLPAYNPDGVVEVTTSVCSVPTAPVTETELQLTEAVTSDNCDTSDGSGNESSETFSARVAHISKDEICVQVLSETRVQPIGELLLLYITEAPPCGVGDYVEVTIDPYVGVDESVPEGTFYDAITVTEKADFVLDESETLAEVTDCFESKRGGYVLTVDMFFYQGYSYQVSLTISSDEEFLVGDWIKIKFAEETCFMESSPLQVSSEYVLGIEKV